ncbi:hypothetical protein OESDEN_06813 [Oesophagostomum dentatum]|uniref:Peptidase S1 domain-containing protein n=1 Tax=Oesophagostomum dentatum TaxID=61180 RepID=A0A0B1TD44_OESDE|nr:hypothetical protein OESDEN_06813 [Oesophagostomum dentatum]
MLRTQESMPVFVHYGGNCVNLDREGKCPKDELSKKIRAAHIVMPRHYFGTNCSEGDIAIIEVDGTFKDLSAYRGYACLPSNTTKLQTSLTSAGYGFDPTRPRAHEKQLERVWYKKERYCDPTVKHGKDAFCVLEKKQFACKGDSGSGVMQPANDFRDYVMGVLSVGLDCRDVHDALEENRIDREFRGSVITNVRKYLEFICYHTGVCEKHVNMKEWRKLRTLVVY